MKTYLNCCWEVWFGCSICVIDAVNIKPHTYWYKLVSLYCIRTLTIHSRINYMDQRIAK